MDGALLQAVRERQPWLSRFTRREYEGAFREYTARYGGAYREALHAADGNRTALADSILDELEQGWKKEAFWRRSVRRMEEKQMVFLYLTPMWMETGEEGFAREFRERWRSRWTKDAYEVTTWQRLQKGFRRTFMGIDITRDDEDS